MFSVGLHVNALFNSLLVCVKGFLFVLNLWVGRRKNNTGMSCLHIYIIYITIALYELHGLLIFSSFSSFTDIYGNNKNKGK